MGKTNSSTLIFIGIIFLGLSNFLLSCYPAGPILLGSDDIKVLENKQKNNPNFKLENLFDSVESFSFSLPKGASNHLLDSLRKKYSVGSNAPICFMDPAITDKNYHGGVSNLNPDEMYWITLYKCKNNNALSENVIKFLEKRNAIFVGPQVLALIWEHRWRLSKEDLPRGGLWIFSFDKKENLLRSADGNLQIPVIGSDLGDGCSFLLSSFNIKLSKSNYFICINEID